MGNKPTGARVFVETFPDRYNPLLLLAFMLVKADKAVLAEPLFHAMGAIIKTSRE
jgi:hypothetical protein